MLQISWLYLRPQGVLLLGANTQQVAGIQIPLLSGSIVKLENLFLGPFGQSNQCFLCNLANKPTDQPTNGRVTRGSKFVTVEQPFSLLSMMAHTLVIEREMFCETVRNKRVTSKMLVSRKLSNSHTHTQKPRWTSYITGKIKKLMLE